MLDYLNPAALDAYWDRNIEPLVRGDRPAGRHDPALHPHRQLGRRRHELDARASTGPSGRTAATIRSRGWRCWPATSSTAARPRTPSSPTSARRSATSWPTTTAHLADARRQARHGHPPGVLRPARRAARRAQELRPQRADDERILVALAAPADARPNRFFVKQASSAAHTYGKRLVGAEAFTTIGPHWNDVPWSAMKPSFDHEFCAGLNLVFNHTFTCSPKEMGLPGQEYFAGTHFNPQVTWWDEAPAFIDYLRRCQYLAQQGDFVADVVYYYGDHIPNIATRKGSRPGGRPAGIRLRCAQRGTPALEPDGEGRPPHAALRACDTACWSLPDHGVLSLGALKKVDALVRAGATVLGPKPLQGGEPRRRRGRRSACSANWPTASGEPEDHAEGRHGKPHGRQGPRRLGDAPPANFSAPTASRPMWRSRSRTEPPPRTSTGSTTGSATRRSISSPNWPARRGSIDATLPGRRAGSPNCGMRSMDRSGRPTPSPSPTAAPGCR